MGDYKMQVSHNEYFIMELFWKEDRPLTRAEILKGTVGRSWNPASVHLIINNMLSKNLIKITDESKKYGRTYESIMTQDEYLRQCIDESLPGKTKQYKLMSIVMALVNMEGITEEDIRKLEAMLEEKREELSKNTSKRKKKQVI
ncbi:MAG: BlaI/MecI/CopY family transcriptional regulator [Lachnospiraceae bacterium]|nr:BlaI/MecI/CopY family transcriptional regulator [Lachnospiraceae bacterium]